MKQLVAQLPPSRPPTQTAVESASPPVEQSNGMRRLEANTVDLSYQAGWQVYGDRRSAVITLAPLQGLVRNLRGGISLGYGAVLSYYRPQSGQSHLQQSTQELISELRAANRDLRVGGQQRRIRVSGNPGLLTVLSGISPYGGRETNFLLTLVRPEGLFYMVLVVPQSQISQVQGTFDQIVDSIRFRG